MKKKIAIVTGADNKYFPFLKNLVLSLNNSNVLEICDLCILMVDEENNYIADIDKFLNKKKKVSFNLKLFFDEKKNWHKLLTERPFLKNHFPGYEKYIWLDADTEVLDSQGIKNLIDATKEKDLAISTEINESYVFKNTKFGIKNIFSSFYKISGWSFKNYKKYFSKDLGEDLFFKPLFNNGVFCMRSDSPFWELWKNEYQAALNRAKTSYGIKTDQLSLNKIIYQNFKKISILDATNNWIIFKSEPMIKINESFFTPSFPRRKINILHYTNYKSDENFVYLENSKQKFSSIIK